MSLLSASSLPFLLLNLIHQLIDLSLKALLELFFHLCVFLEFVSRLSESHLELFTSFFTLTNESLILCNVSFQVIENLEFLIEGNQSVQLVLKLNLFLLKSKLELRIITLDKHSCSESLHSW